MSDLCEIGTTRMLHYLICPTNVLQLLPWIFFMKKKKKFEKDSFNHLVLLLYQLILFFKKILIHSNPFFPQNQIESLI
jgi:hypothetical protein